MAQLRQLLAWAIQNEINVADLEVLGLDGATIAALDDIEVVSVAQLAQMTPEALLGVHNLGPDRIANLLESLAELKNLPQIIANDQARIETERAPFQAAYLAAGVTGQEPVDVQRHRPHLTVYPTAHHGDYSG